jgi:hypothetical protein
MKNVSANLTKWLMAIALFSLMLDSVRDAREADVSCSQNTPW